MAKKLPILELPPTSPSLIYMIRIPVQPVHYFFKEFQILVEVLGQVTMLMLVYSLF
jgi:hypothetical protein